MRLLPVFPWPVPVALPIEPDVVPVAAVPGGPSTVLGINQYPPFVCDVAVVRSPEGLPAAIDIVLSGEADPRLYTKADYLRDLLGGREMTEYEILLEDPDFEPTGVYFR